mmetsp:Transcript_87842/g.190248  ORF Transcript_87842/g.190248 Transcript_87842/m.190248 type:complete len:107 (+) Transcript_87842:286-606(+)
MKAETVRGIARVIIFDPNHSLTLAVMTKAQLLNVINLWSEQFVDLKQKQFLKYIQIFENKGAINGCSNPHPHGQIWATDHIPELPRRKIESMQEYYLKNKSHLLID